MQNNEDLDKKTETLSETISRLESENEEVKIERDDCDRMRLDAIKKHESQMKALNQNLANLRVELKQKSDRLSESEQVIEKIKSDNLEMESKLSTVIDEKNQMESRCQEAEKRCEAYETQIEELNKKLNDVQSALHEIGREHSTLQVGMTSRPRLDG